MKTSILVLLTFLSLTLFAQKDCDDFPKNYIPVDLNDAINYLDCIWGESEKNDFKSKPENEATIMLHHGYGTGLRNSWGLWKGNSGIYNYFKDVGVFHPDDMSGIILKSFHRYLNGKDIEIEKQVKYYTNYWKRQEIRQNKLKETHFNNFKINDTIYFKYKLGFSSQNQEDGYYENICDAKAVLIEKKPSNLQLKVRLIESCDPLGVIIAREDVFEKKDLKMVLVERGKKSYMKSGEVNWTYFDLWQKN